MTKLRDAAIALIAKQASDENLDDIVRQLQGLPSRPEETEPLKSIFAYKEALDPKTPSESVREDFDPNAPIDWHNFNCKISKYFTAGEVARYDTRRIPKERSVQANAIALAKELDKIRESWGSPIGVTSWHRPIEINRAVGSGDWSQHIHGTAADIYPMDGSTKEFQDWLDPRFSGALGYGAWKGFVHVDIRNGGGFDGTKGDIRWDY